MKKNKVLPIKLTAADTEFVLNLSMVEFNLLSLVDPLSFLRTIVLRPPGSKAEVRIPASAMREELARLNSLLADDRWFYKYQYYTDETFDGDAGPHTGRIGGLRLPGIADCSFDIDSGVGYCKLIRIRIDPVTGRGREDGEIDIRDQTSVETDGAGTIRIERKPVAKQLRQKLAALAEWAAPLTGAVRAKLLR
jgi:hypothetical protein